MIVQRATEGLRDLLFYELESFLSGEAGRKAGEQQYPVAFGGNIG